MNIIIHRGTKEVGGSCVEITCQDSCILIDFGIPLGFDFDEDINSVLPEPLYSNIINGNKKIDALVLSHAHLDHYGLIGKLPKEIPIYMGKATAELIRYADNFTTNKIGQIKPIIFNDHELFKICSFEIMPYSADHSAFDSYAFLITNDNKSIFYSGDFRAHGREHEKFDNLICNPPKVDLLLMEGTLIGERIDEPNIEELEVERKLVGLCLETKGTVFVTVPSMNIDRIISIYNAAKQTGRKFILDLHAAELFDRLKNYSNDIPQSSHSDVLLWYPKFQRENFDKHGLNWLMQKHKYWKKTLKDFSSEIPKSIMMLRPYCKNEIEKNADLSGSVWVYSMWKGYLGRKKSLQDLKQWTEGKGIPFKFLHTTGHAQLQDLKRLAKALSPQVLIPIHSYHCELFSEHFENVHRLEDGEVFSL
ncbi:MAG: MBL fold metallo-hydrolase [Smithellaceae bacterium]|jgi:ribonuclease J